MFAIKRRKFFKIPVCLFFIEIQLVVDQTRVTKFLRRLRQFEKYKMLSIRDY